MDAGAAWRRTAPQSWRACAEHPRFDTAATDAAFAGPIPQPSYFRLNRRRRKQFAREIQILLMTEKLYGAYSRKRIASDSF